MGLFSVESRAATRSVWFSSTIFMLHFHQDGEILAAPQLSADGVHPSPLSNRLPLQNDALQHSFHPGFYLFSSGFVSPTWHTVSSGQNPVAESQIKSHFVVIDEAQATR